MSAAAARVSSDPAPGAPAQPDRVLRLALSAFRNHVDVALAAGDAPFVGLVGPNGAGKTNILEAISLLSPGRSLRGASFDDIARIGDDRPWRAHLTLDAPYEPKIIAIGADRTEGGAWRRALLIDGAPLKASSGLADHVSVMWLTPAMDRLFAESPSSRRRFLDRMVFGLDPAQAARVSAYEKAMRERARLLRDRAGDAAWIGALERKMAELGVAVAAARLDWARHRADMAAMRPPAPFPRAELRIDGWVEDRLAESPALAVEDAFADALAAARGADQETPIGPHRSDMRATHGETGAPAERCSTGEQKAIVLAIALTHARLRMAIRGRAPVLLLDEVAAHMDARRRDDLFAALSDLGAQCWMTATEAAAFAALGERIALFEIAPGEARPARPN